MDYLIDHYDDIFMYLLEHIFITCIVIVISFVIAFPLGIIASKCKHLTGILNGIVNLIYAIPSLALFSFLMPITGIGDATAIIAFVVYNQYMLVKNISEGFDTISPSIREVGEGLGYSKLNFFFSVELPLAMPSMINGLKLASIGTVTGATLGATIGAGGLGVLIFRGLNMRHWDKVIIGTILCTIIAILLSTSFQHLEDHARRKAQGEL